MTLVLDLTPRQVEPAGTGTGLTVGQFVSITCDECRTGLVRRVADNPENAMVLASARAFLEEHRGCAISMRAGDYQTGR